MTWEAAGQKGPSGTARWVAPRAQGVESHATCQLLSGSHTSLESHSPCLRSRNEMGSHWAPSAGPSVEGSHTPLTPPTSDPANAPWRPSKSSPTPLLGALVTPRLSPAASTHPLGPWVWCPALLETKHAKSWKGPFRDPGAIAQTVTLRPEVAASVTQLARELEGAWVSRESGSQPLAPPPESAPLGLGRSSEICLLNKLPKALRCRGHRDCI